MCPAACSLHDNLLSGETGRRINGLGALFVTLLCVTGAIIWWPGTRGITGMYLSLPQLFAAAFDVLEDYKGQRSSVPLVGLAEKDAARN